MFNTWDFSPGERSSPSATSHGTPSTPKSDLFDYFSLGETPAESARDNFVLVVGGLGYIGSHTSWELLKAGFNVVIVDDLSNSYRDVLYRLNELRMQICQKDINRPKLDYYEADYRDQKSMRSILSRYQTGSQSSAARGGRSAINGVIHFAAHKAVADSFIQPLDYYANNVGGMIDFCAILGEFGIKTFIFSSSATVYGEVANEGTPLLEEYCNNQSCRGLTSPYGRTKWMCEAILHDLAVADPEWTIIALRYFNPIGCDESGQLGEGPRGTPNNLMPIVIKVIQGELPQLDIYGTDWDTPDGTAIRDFIHVSDLARGHLAALMAKYELGGGFKTFNLGTGTGHSVKEIVTSMERASGRSIATNAAGRRDGDVGVCVAEPARSLQMLRWETVKTLDDCCMDICRFLHLDFPTARKRLNM